jgi:rRNA processing protein Krr1/Pno1
MTLVECKNFDINPYDAERIIELRKLFNIGLNISDALGIIETLENNYSIDSFDLHDILNRK